MTRKRVNKILWHGNDLNEDGSAKAPSVASYAGALDGLNPGELYICDADGAPTLFMVTDGGRVVPIGGVNSEELKKLFIRKDTNDRTPFKLEVGDKLTAEKGIQISKNFVSGIVGGSGGYIYLDENGKVVIETDKAVFREEMITPKITFNCIDVISGDKANTFAFGTFKDVDTESRIATLDLLDNQWGTSHVSDICRGIFHNIGGSNTEKDTIGANGFIEYSGYATSYFTPTRILENEAGNMKFEYELQVGTNIHPMPGMNFFAYGNFKDKDRQAITYENRYYTRRLAHVNTWVIDPEVNVMMQTGDLSGLSIGGMDFSGYSFYGKNVYISGTIERLKPNGTPAKDLSYEGVWESGRKYDYYDSVTHDGSTWACMNKNGSSAEPGTNNDWQKIASKGDKGDPGESAVFADLANEMDNVTLTNDGKVYQDTSISTVAWMSYGSKKMTLTGITCTLPANVTETHDVSTGEITFSVKQGVALDGRNPIPVALTATYNGKAYTGQLTFTLAGVKGGADAVLYRLVPSVSAVIKDANGNLNVTSVSCTRLKSSVSGGTAETGTGELKYSLDGGAEVSIGNNAGVPVSSFQKSIKFIFYVDGKEVDVETIPLVTDGKDGQSVSSLGPWYTGLFVPKLSIVTMGGSSFCSKKDTSNPPLWTTTTSDGRRILQTQDGGKTYGYILSGESNTEEYDLLVQSGKDGSDGKGYEYIFKSTTTNTRPATPATSQTDDYVPSGWNDDPVGVSATVPYEWVSKRTKKDGVWSAFSTPEPWANHSFNAISADLDNQMDNATLDENGKTIEALSLVITASMWNGSTKLALSSISVQSVTGITSSYILETGVITLSIAKGISLPDRTEIPITLKATADGIEHTRTLKFTLAGVKGGKNAVLYSLVTSVSNIVKKKDGTYSVSGVSATRMKTVGGVSQATTDGTLKYSIDGGSETATNNGVSIPSSSISTKVVFSFYDASGVLVDIESIPMIQDGKDGQGYTQMGPFKTGLIIPKMGVVSMGGSSFVSKVPTTNPPLWTVTTSDGRRILQTQDGGKTYGYILSGEMNSAEYDLLASKGDTGAPGKDGTNGTDGKDGEQGIQGCITRHSEWAVGVTYRNDEALTSGTRYVDIAMIRNNAAIDGWDVYKCNTTHTSSESNKPGVSSSTWTKLSGVGPIYTSLIIAKNASIDFMQGNQLLIKKDDGTVTAGLSGSIAGSKVRIWAGSATPDNAPFRVLESGKVICMNAEVHGDINATSGTFKNVSSPNGSFKIKENGDVELVGKISTSLNGTRIELDPSSNSIKMYNQDNNEVGNISFITESIGGVTNYYPRLMLRRYSGSKEVGRLDMSGTSVNGYSTVGTDALSFTLGPIGLVFSVNGQVTNSYPNK